MIKNNPLLMTSELPFGAPMFDKIKKEHYLPAIEQAIASAKEDVDAIVADPREPDFENTIVALEQSGATLDSVCNILFNLLEADSDEQMQEIAEKVSPLLTEYQLYVTLNEAIFARVKRVYDRKDSLNLQPDQRKLLEDSYKAFIRNGANLDPDAKKTLGSYDEELSLLSLQFGKNVLDATNAFTLHLSDEAELEGLPQYVRDAAAEAASLKGLDGWLFDLTAPSYRPFMKFSARSGFRKSMYMAYNTRAVEANSPIVTRMAELRRLKAALLGYDDYAGYALEDRMAGNEETVNDFLNSLLVKSLPAARRDVKAVLEFARARGYEEEEMQPWDFSYWSEQYKNAYYSLNDELLKPYFKLENCITAVFGLANTLYGLEFKPLDYLPVYHEDVKVFEVTDASGVHKALLYADFFPRASKRGGAWMTEFRGQSIVGGVEKRPFISIVTNFSKATASSPSLLTHDELVTFLHEFGHALHGILAEGRYASQTGTNVARDFVELPSQLMENWAFEPEWLNTFARHYETGETIAPELIDKMVKVKNFQSGYLQLRQLQFGILDMAWHSLHQEVEGSVLDFEKKVLEASSVLPSVKGCCISSSFNHIFSGGYSAGYYSYKWAEVLEADAFSLFKEKGIFSKEAADAFRECILTKGSTRDERELYREFRGHDPQIEALLEKLGISEQGE